MTCTNEYGQLSRVMLLHARAVFDSDERIAREWQALNFTAPPDRGRAIAEYDAFAATLGAAGARIDECPAAPDVTLDAIYVRDASIVTPRGVILARMGKPSRQTEPAAQQRAFDACGVPVLGAIEAPGQLEGGDLVWFDERTVAVGRGYRTNDAGIAQLRRYLGDDVHVEVVGLPHYRGPSDVFHLMSIISPIDRDLTVVYSPLMPVPFRCWLLERGITLVEVPDSEFDSMGANVLAVGPRRALMLEGNRITRARLEAAGVQVWAYEGTEISIKGGGGPTCLTRPLERLGSPR
jgi:N-dimethylarginine dimethylaminohydrolase